MNMMHKKKNCSHVSKKKSKENSHGKRMFQVQFQHVCVDNIMF